MYILPNDDGDGFYPVDELCKATKKYIIKTIPDDKRYIYGKWFVHYTELPSLAKRAKDTGHHTVISYDGLPSHIVESIDFALKVRKKKPITGSLDYYSELHLLPSAPDYILEAAWKAIVRKSHPDVGGDSNSFLRVKEAYEHIIKERQS